MMAAKVRILVGTSGFSYPDWHGTFYPPDFKKRKIHELQFLSEFFVRSTTAFYRPVNPEVAKKWCEYVSNNKEFQFTAKLTEVLPTHLAGEIKSLLRQKLSDTRRRMLRMRRKDLNRSPMPADWGRCSYNFQSPSNTQSDANFRKSMNCHL
jgi:uncharacterized protein YecE (DUF72 family)